MTARPPPANLLARIEQARAELAEREAERKAAWYPPPRQPLPCFEWECDWGPKNFHSAFQRWEQARDHLRALEREREAS